MILHLRADIQKLLSGPQTQFDQVMQLRGEKFRHQDGRLTQRLLLDKRPYFIKQHAGVGWKEIFKNILQLRAPVLGAGNEWRAMEKLRSLGLNVPVVAGYGQRGKNPARLQSFILMEELAPVISLEDLAREWGKKPRSIALKRKLIAEIARIARSMHQNGINHRDFYLCHFLLDISPGLENIHAGNVRLFLIDLHRAQIRRLTPERWIVKDLAGLYFSCNNIKLSRRDLLHFVRHYRAKPLREVLASEKEFWQKVERRGSTYRDHTK